MLIFIGLSLNTPQEETSYTELKPNVSFFHEDLSAQSTINKLFTHKDFLNKTSLVFFGYTRCPDFCPNTLMQLSKVHKELNESKSVDTTKLQIIFISVDTKNDDISSIEKYVQYFDKHFIGLRLNETSLDALAKSAGVYYKKVSETQGIDIYDHTGTIFIIDDLGKTKGVFTPPFLESALKLDIIQLLN